MRAYLSCLSDTMADLLDAAEKNPETIKLGPLPEAAKAEVKGMVFSSNEHLNYTTVNKETFGAWCVGFLEELKIKEMKEKSD